MVVQCRVAASTRSKISASPRIIEPPSARSSNTTRAPSETAQSARARARAATARPRDPCRRRTAREHGIERRQRCRACCLQRLANHLVWCAGRCDVVAKRQLQPEKVLEDSRQPRAPRVHIERSDVDAVDLDRTASHVVKAAQQFGDRRLSRAVLSHDCERGPRRYGEVEPIENGRATRIRKRYIRKRTSLAGATAPSASPTRQRQRRPSTS